MLYSNVPLVQYSTIYADILSNSTTSTNSASQVQAKERHEFIVLMSGTESPLDPSQYLPNITTQLTWLEGHLIRPQQFPEGFYPLGEKGREVQYEFGWALGRLFLVAPSLLPRTHQQSAGERLAGWVRYS